MSRSPLPRLRVLSGDEVSSILSDHGFQPTRQRGSHVIMQQKAVGGTRSVPVPLHRELAPGTLLSIIRQSGLDRSLFETD